MTTSSAARVLSQLVDNRQFIKCVRSRLTRDDCRNIKIDYRENAGIRVAPHFYNTDDEVREAVTAITDILDDGSWQQHSKSRDFVT